MSNFTIKLNTVADTTSFVASTKTLAKSVPPIKIKALFETPLASEINKTNQLLKGLYAEGTIGASTYKSLSAEVLKVEQLMSRGNITFEQGSKQLNKIAESAKGVTSGFKEIAGGLGGVIAKFSLWYLIAGLVTGVINSFKDMVKQVIMLDASLVELSKTTNITEKDFARVESRAFNLAKQLGQTGKSVIDATTEFTRAGYSLEEAFNLAKVAITLTNVAENIKDAGEAATYLISILKGANLPISEASRLLDELNHISNNFAVDLGSLADMVQRASGTMSTFGNTIEETMALITGAYEVLQDERVARGVSTIAANIAGLNEDLEKEEGLANKVSNALLKYANIDVFDLNGQLRSTYDILEELAGKWDNLSKNAQSVLLSTMAGKTRMDVLSSILRNWEGVANSLAATTEAEGSAVEEQEKYLNSIEGRIAQLSNAWQSLAAKTIDSDLIKWFIDFAKTIIEISDYFGGLANTLLVFSGVIGAIKLTGMIRQMREMSLSLKSITFTASATTTAVTGLKLALAGLSTVLGAVGIIMSIIGAIRSENEKLENQRLERISNIKEEIAQLKALKESYLELKNSTEDSVEVNEKIAKNYEKLARLANAYAVSINKVNGEQKNYLELSQEVNIAQLKALQREQRSAYESAEKFLNERRGDAVSLPGNTLAFLTRGTAQERLSQIEKEIERYEELISKDSGNSKWYKALLKPLIKAYSDLSDEILKNQEIVDEWKQNEQLLNFTEKYQQELNSLIDGYQKWTNLTKQEQTLTSEQMTDELNSFINKVKSEYSSLTDYIDEQTQEMLSKYKAALNYDYLLDVLEKQTSLIKERQKAEKEELSTQEKLLAVEKARFELEEARKKKTTMFRVGKGFVQGEDVSAIESAQEKLTKAERDAGLDPYSQSLKNIEKLVEYYNQAQLDQAGINSNEMRKYFADADNMTDFLALSIQKKFEKLAEWITTQDWQKTTANIDVSGFYGKSSSSLPSVNSLNNAGISNASSPTIVNLSGNLEFPNVSSSEDARSFIDEIISIGRNAVPSFN